MQEETFVDAVCYRTAADIRFVSTASHAAALLVRRAVFQCGSVLVICRTAETFRRKLKQIVLRGWARTSWRHRGVGPSLRFTIWNELVWNSAISNRIEKVDVQCNGLRVSSVGVSRDCTFTSHDQAYVCNCNGITNTYKHNTCKHTEAHKRKHEHITPTHINTKSPHAHTNTHTNKHTHAHTHIQTNTRTNKHA